MTFWIIATAIALLSIAPIALVLRRGRGMGAQSTSTAEIEMKVYRDQLKEVERDLARGVLSQEDAKRTRTEVSRRMLEADKEHQGGKAGAPKGTLWGAIALALALLAGGVWLYDVLGQPKYEDLPLAHRIALADEIRATRMSQDDAEAKVPATPMAQQADQQLIDLVIKLRAALQSRPDELEGHILLARNEANIGNFREAYQAQNEVIRIKGAEATAEDYAQMANLMILSAGGFVSPEAETALSSALKRDPNNGIAVFFSGLMFAQNDRPDMTFRLWQPLLTRSEPTDPWVPLIREQIEAVAQAAGIRYTLPPANDGLKGPSAEDMKNAADMTPEERQEMIRGMVEGLSARLANEGGTPEEWARLISSLAMLGDTERAKAIWGEAQVIFGADPEKLTVVRAGAERAGFVE